MNLEYLNSIELESKIEAEILKDIIHVLEYPSDFNDSHSYNIYKDDLIDEPELYGYTQSEMDAFYEKHNLPKS